MQLQIALIALIGFAIFTSINSPYNSNTLNRLSTLSYIAGIIYLLGRLAMRSLDPALTALGKEPLGVKSRGPISAELLAGSDFQWAPEQSDEYMTIAVWVTFGLIIAIEAYFVWRLFLLSLESCTEIQKCQWLVRLFTCCCCSHTVFRQVVLDESPDTPKPENEESAKAVEVPQKDENGNDVQVKVSDIKVDIKEEGKDPSVVAGE